MPDIAWTAQQREAIETIGQSVIVSAAAGAGKTAVLAERCAYLICDAPPGSRCNVEDLLVLTFTDAAAAEMRSRIVSALRDRLQARPRDARLREQVALADAAQISTIHSFCFWVLRRWFSEAGIDPMAAVLDADEATLLKREVLDDLFTHLYAAAREEGHPLGARLTDEATVENTSVSVGTRTPDGVSGRHAQIEESVARGFLRLVDDYGLSSDRDVAALVLSLASFVESLPDPEGWLREAADAPMLHPEAILARLEGELAIELRQQAEHCMGLAEQIEAGDPVGDFYAEQIREYAGQVETWLEMLASTDGGRDTVDFERSRGLKPAARGERSRGLKPAARGERSRGLKPAARDERSRGLKPAARDRDGITSGRLRPFEAVREQIEAFAFSNQRGPRLAKDADSALCEARDAASERLSAVKTTLFKDRLRSRFALFSIDERIEDLARTGPYAATIVEVVRFFRRAYAERKRRNDVLDFTDLERHAYDLLAGTGPDGAPSEVARALQRRFAYVLVDEFQDINPLQESIIRLASREAAEGSEGNLFVVGDVKQSIYRFRLAEPQIFLNRLLISREPATASRAIALQENFRSRPEILDAVNLVFERIMRVGSSSVEYDAEAQLRPGRSLPQGTAHESVEVHVLQKTWQTDDDDGDDEPEAGVPEFDDPSRWTSIEREAYLIGSRIRAWMDAGWGKLNGEPLAYRDVAILLRAAKVNAERMSSMLQAMGIPAHADVGGSLFGAVEVRTVLAALQVLDNFQQDIPLAAVLRSGIFGEQLSDDELVEIRCVDREVPFHEAVRSYRQSGSDETLRDKLDRLLGRVDRFRAEARRHPLAETLWRLYDEFGYLAYAGGLPNGEQRRANLLKLHELARRFGTFQRQGLLRFLRFVKSLEDEKQDIAAAPAMSESDDVVRIMSIHQSKGLEFPIVFVAGLGTRFNLGDRSGRMIHERESGLGLRVVDPERMIEYPTASHLCVAAEVERSTREEEQRILYVAMTRAREKLVLIGAHPNIRSIPDIARSGRRTPSLFSLTTAATPLDWLIPILGSAPAGIVTGLGGEAADPALLQVHLHETAAMTSWRADLYGGGRESATRTAAAALAPLAAEEPFAPDDPEVDEVIRRTEYVYPRLASGTLKAVVVPSEAKRTYEYAQPLDERPAPATVSSDFRFREVGEAQARPSEAARRGTAVHRVLQRLAFDVAVDPAGVASELQRIQRDAVLPREDFALVDDEALAWFVGTPLAARIRAAGTTYRREFQYIATESPEYFDATVEPGSDDEVLVRGIVDGILPTEDGLEIIDFKTDAVDRNDVELRAERYRPQMALYSRAMAAIWRRPATRCWLVFLAARMIVEVPGGDSGRVACFQGAAG